ncbi:MAG: hypothetical protein ACW967_03520 [Candidatus Hodarchaeales archaeon]
MTDNNISESPNLDRKKYQRRINVIGNQASGKSRATLGIANIFGEKLLWNEVSNLGGTINPISYRFKTKLPEERENQKESDIPEKKTYSPSYISLFEDITTNNWPEYTINLTDHPGQQVYKNLRTLAAIQSRKSDLEEILKHQDSKTHHDSKKDAEGLLCFLDGAAWNFRDIALAHAIELIESIPPRVKKVPIGFIINKIDLVNSFRHKIDEKQVLDLLAKQLSERINYLVENNPYILQYVNHSLPGYPTLQIHAQLFINEEVNIVTIPFSHLEQFIANELREILPSFMITGEWLHTTTAQMARALTLSLMEIGREVGLVSKAWSNVNIVSELNMRRAKPYGQPFYEKEDISVSSQFQIPIAQLDGSPIIKPEYMQIVFEDVITSKNKVAQYIDMVDRAIKSGKFKQLERFELLGYVMSESISKKGIGKQVEFFKKLLRFEPVVEMTTSDELAMEKLSLDMF